MSDLRLPDAQAEAEKIWRLMTEMMQDPDNWTSVADLIRDIQYRTLMASAEMAISDENAWKWSGKGAEWLTDLATSLKEGK